MMSLISSNGSGVGGGSGREGKGNAKKKSHTIPIDIIRMRGAYKTGLTAAINSGT
jgi:hypothetical protein